MVGGGGKEKTEILLQAPWGCSPAQPPLLPGKLLLQEARTPAVEEEPGSQARSQADHRHKAASKLGIF